MFRGPGSISAGSMDEDGALVGDNEGMWGTQMALTERQEPQHLRSTWKTGFDPAEEAAVGISSPSHALILTVVQISAARIIDFFLNLLGHMHISWSILNCCACCLESVVCCKAPL